MSSKTMRKPDVTGAIARGWLLPLKPIGQRGAPDYDGTVATWMVNGPFHPFWSWWTLSVIHLRPIEGVRPPFKRSPDMTHELMIMAIDPATCPPDIDNPDKGYAWLSPVDVVEQFAVPKDEDAIEMAKLAVRAICGGLISPDQDYRRAWSQVIAETADHARRHIHRKN